MSPLLFLAHRIPYPPDKGDKIRSFHVLRHLASRFEINLGCFCDDPDDIRHAANLREFCSEVFCLPLSRAKLLPAFVRAALRGQSTSEAYYHDVRLAKWVAEILQRKRIHEIYVFSSAMAPYALPHRAGKRLVLDMVDVDSRKWGEYGAAAQGLLRPVFRLEERRVRALELRGGIASDRVLLVSDAERNAFAALAPLLAGRAACMPNGVDTAYFDPSRSRPNPFAPDARAIVFTGAMDYRANIDAVLWFARACFPAIRAAHGDAQFWIVGSNPTLAIRRLEATAGICVTGKVPDVRPYLAHAACAIAPLRIARGIQNKVLEAMAMKTPMVVTPAALEGITAQHEREVLVAESEGGIANRVTEILSGEWDGMGSAARDHVEKFHRWQDALAVLDETFPEHQARSPAAAAGRIPAEVA